jgi:hypothetical protein
LDISFLPSSAAHSPLSSAARVRGARFSRGIVSVDGSPPPRGIRGAVAAETDESEKNAAAVDNLIKDNIVVLLI